MNTANSIPLGDEPTAGFKLLDKFQLQWKQIHFKGERNINKAKTVVTKLNSIEKSSYRRLDALNNFSASCRTLSSLGEQINSIDNDIKLLESYFVRIEDFLTTLKNYKESMDAKQYLKDLQVSYNLQVHEQKTISEAKRERLRLEHLKRVDAFEREQERELEDRRRILEQTFEEEKTRYLENTKKD